jgi:hypothetical protein
MNTMIDDATITAAGNKRPRLSKREKEDYLKAMMEINPADIDWLIGTLLYTRAKENREATSITFKICDFCSLTYRLGLS